MVGFYKSDHMLEQTALVSGVDAAKWQNIDGKLLTVKVLMEIALWTNSQKSFLSSYINIYEYFLSQ